MDDILFGSATEAARSLRQKEISARELLDLVYARMDEVEPTLNAVVERRRDLAEQEAGRADDALASGADTGPLHGVPMTVKECFYLAGTHTTWGMEAARTFKPDWDASVVRLLKAAGVTIAGKTNVPYFLAEWQSFNDIYGTTNNPWNPEVTPGGSTGGGAAILAAGGSFLEYGTDLVGSIRVPASFCGVYGLKPSPGIVPAMGMQPPGAPPADPIDLAHLTYLGPLARTAADLRLALLATSGLDGPAATAYTWKLPAPRHQRLRDFRVGVVLDHESDQVTGEVATVLQAAVDAIRATGATVVEGWPDGVDPVQARETFGFHVGLFLSYFEGEYDQIGSYLVHERRRMELRAAWARYFSDVDVLVCPTAFTPAFPHDHRPREERVISTPEGDRPHDLSFWVAQPSIAGLPAVSAPVGRTASGLPVGLQVIGPAYDDDTAITFAERLADVVGGYERPPL